jgi:hypothetical protein
MLDEKAAIGRSTLGDSGEAEDVKYADGPWYRKRMLEGRVGVCNAATITLVRLRQTQGQVEGLSSVFPTVLPTTSTPVAVPLPPSSRRFAGHGLPLPKTRAGGRIALYIGQQHGGH